MLHYFPYSLNIVFWGFENLSIFLTASLIKD